MSWLDDIRYLFRYECKTCGQEHAFDMASKEHTDEMQAATAERGICTACGAAGLDYLGFKPAETMNLTAGTVRETFEQNGRKGIKIGKTFISATKDHYLKTGRIENQYTEGFKQHLLKNEVENEHLLRTETNRRRAIVTKASPRLAAG